MCVLQTNKQTINKQIKIKLEDLRRISPPDASWSYPSLMSVQISNDNFFELYYDFQEKQKLEMPGFKEIDDKIFKYQL